MFIGNLPKTFCVSSGSWVRMSAKVFGEVATGGSLLSFPLLLAACVLVFFSFGGFLPPGGLSSLVDFVF